MESLYGYICEASNPVSDDAILYKIGKYKFNANQTEFQGPAREP